MLFYNFQVTVVTIDGVVEGVVDIYYNKGCTHVLIELLVTLLFYLRLIYLVNSLND